MSDFFHALRIGWREFKTAYRNIKRMKAFDKTGKFSPF